MQWSIPLLVLGCNIGAMLDDYDDEESCKTYMDPVGCTMEWRRPIISLDCHTSPVLDKARSRCHLGKANGRSPPVFLLGYHLGAVLEEDPYQTQMTIFGCQMQRSPPVFPLGCRVGTMLEEDPCQI
jgi:hypothetical protein